MTPPTSKFVNQNHLRIAATGYAGTKKMNLMDQITKEN